LQIHVTHQETDFFRVDDDAALRSKVDEALTVYDDYMKTKAKDGPNGTQEEASGEAAA
jgi:hypothetical protein